MKLPWSGQFGNDQEIDIYINGVDRGQKTHICLLHFDRLLNQFNWERKDVSTSLARSTGYPYGKK